MRKEKEGEREREREIGLERTWYKLDISKVQRLT
jgi:hypothetical protein